MRYRSAFFRTMALLRTTFGQAQGTTPTDRRKATGQVREQAPYLRPRLRLHLWGIGLIAAFVLLPFIYSTVSAASMQDQQTQQAQHAVLLSSRPAAGDQLQSPPPSVHMVFSEALIPATSKALVVDTTNRQVDMKDSHVSNGKEMDLTLPLLPAGTYVVVWQTQSAIDGHVARSSFLFRITRPDGSVPPIPAVLPTGHIPGAGGIGVQSNTSLDGPTLLQTTATWIALLLFTFWVGGIIWETWIFAPQQHSPFAHSSAIEQASQRWRTYAPYALAGILIANVGIIVGLAAELAGDWSGSTSFPLLHAILFESSFGAFWWLREGVTLIALLFAVGLIRSWTGANPVPIAPNHKLQPQEENAPTVETVLCASPTTPDASSTQDALLRGESALIKVLAGIPHLPGHLIEGIRQRSSSGRVECLLALALMFAFALSGHAAAASSSAVWAVIGIDLLHLLAEAAWIGGLLYIGVALLPTLNKQSNYEWANVLAIGLPRFSVIAITSVILLAITGSFNTTVHLTSFQQFWTTTYGRTLTVKIVVFLLMIGISAYHAFSLRPRLTSALVETAPCTYPTDTHPPHSHPTGAVPNACEAVASPTDEQQTISSHAHTLGKNLERWLRLEGILGAIVLLCVALLGTFAGSLTATTPSTIPSQPTGPVTQTQTVDGYTITLKVTPATFGTNTFTVLVKNAQGQPETGAAVLIATSMLDMNMGTETTQLQADPKQPGVYSKQADLTMAGRWEVGVRVFPANSNSVKAIFDFSTS